MFWPKSIQLPPDSAPLWKMPIETPQALEETRARAYQMARSEMPAWFTRAEVMAAANEIFEYLRYGTKPQPKAS